MGLAFSHGTAQWSYRGFHVFRRKLARSIGLDIDLMQGYAVRWGILWSVIEHPLAILLSHSDCDGELSPEECRQIAPRLKEIVEPWVAWPEDPTSDRENALALAAAMEECAEKGEALKFC